jgi:hypothetical protein
MPTFDAQAVIDAQSICANPPALAGPAFNPANWILPAFDARAVGDTRDVVTFVGSQLVGIALIGENDFNDIGNVRRVRVVRGNLGLTRSGQNQDREYQQSLHRFPHGHA